MRFFSAVLMVVALAACSDKEFTCRAGGQCVDRYGAIGLCLEMHCAFPAARCSSGYEWDDAAGDQAGECVDKALVPADAGPGGVADARPADAS
jgi:hypothetical protein